eukprot:g11814.t1
MVFACAVVGVFATWADVRGVGVFVDDNGGDGGVAVGVGALTGGRLNTGVAVLEMPAVAPPPGLVQTRFPWLLLGAADALPRGADGLVTTDEGGGLCLNGFGRVVFPDELPTRAAPAIEFCGALLALLELVHTRLPDLDVLLTAASPRDGGGVGKAPTGVAALRPIVDSGGGRRALRVPVEPMLLVGLSHVMNKRRSEVSVAPLRPLALNRATSEILPYRGTLFLKVIKGTQLVQAPQLAPQKESKSKLARLSALLGDARAEAGAMMHAVSVTSWLTEAEPEAGTPVGGGDSPDRRPSISGERYAGGSFSSSSGGNGGGRVGVASSPGAGAGQVAGQGGVVWRTPKPGAARTSPKFVNHGDPEGGASWDEEFFFGRVSGDIAVRIVCIDKPLREGAEDEVVGELLIPVSRLPQNEPVEQWYGLEPPVGSGKTFTKAALLLRFLFTTSTSPDAKSAASAASAASGAAKGGAGGALDGRRQSLVGPPNEGGGLPAAGVGGGRAGGGDMGGAAAESAPGYRGGGRPGPAAEDDGFNRALLMSGVAPEGIGGGGGNAAAASKMRSWKGVARPGVGTGEEFAVDTSIDPYGADEIEDDGALRGGRGGRGGAEDDVQAHRGEPTLLPAQQLQLGNWGNTNIGTVHVGTAAAEAALALSTDEILPAGLVDYFLVVGPATDEAGKLRVADYADCGFGSTGAAPAPGGGPAIGELPATAVEVESAVLEHFPEEQREDAPFPTKVEWFCFPQGLFLMSAASQPAPHVSSFVRFTSGVRSYGLCLTFYRQVDVLEEEEEKSNLFVATGGKGGESADGSGRSGVRDGTPRRKGRLWCPVCLCVLTHIPVLEGLMHWLRMFHWCLVRLEKESGGPKRLSRRPTELDAAVFQLTLELPLPVPGVCAMSAKAFGKRFAACPEPEFSLPGIRELPALSFPLGLLLRSLRPKGVLQLFAAILQEGRILLHSTKPALLAAVAEGVFALMYPLQWPYAYVPVLPNCLIEHVESPQPFILGVHTDWLSDISPDALEELIIVDCDLGTVDGPDMEQLPPPVRRSLTKTVRAVLHGNLGNLDAPVRLSKPELSAAAAASAAAQARGGGGGSSAGMPARGKGGAFPFSQQPGASASSNGLGRTVAAVGLSAWVDPDPRAAVAAAGSGDAAGQGGGEKSAEMGDSSSRGQSSGGGAGGEGGATVRKARRGRARGAAARMEGLLRLEFARAMADMLYGFTECLFFLHPDRPIFNGARFLQEYCEESYVPFMSVVIDTLAFKYLLETQDTPPLRPFHDMLDKARRDALKKGGDIRKHQMALVPHGQAQAKEAPASAGAFDGPFPVVNGLDDLSFSRSKSFDAAGGGEAGGEAGAARGGGGGLPPPAFAIPSPPLASFTRHAVDGDESNEEPEEIDFNASRGKEGYGISRGGSSGSGVSGGTGGGGGGSGGGAEEAEEAEEAEQAAEEVREQGPPSFSAAVGAATGSGGTNTSGAPGTATAAAAAARRRSSDGGGFKSRPKREERSGLRLSDARGSFIGGSMVKSAGGGHRQGKKSVEEADEMAYEGEEDDGDEEGRSRRWSSAGRRGSAASSLPSSSWQHPRKRAQEIEAECYDSAGDWGSDGSDGLPAVLAARKRGAAEDTAAAAAAAVAAEATAAADGPRRRRTRSALSMGGASEDATNVGYAGSDTDQQEATEGTTGAAGASQSAGESALEEKEPGSLGLAVGEGTAPPAPAAAPPSPPSGGMSTGRASAIAAAAARRKSSGGGGGGGGGGGWSVRDRVAALQAKSGGGSVRDKVASLSAPKKEVLQDGDATPSRGSSLDLAISSNNTDDDADVRVRSWVSGSALKNAFEKSAKSEIAQEVSPSKAPPSYAAAVIKRRPSIPGISEDREVLVSGASDDSTALGEPAAPAESALSRREGAGPALRPSSLPERRSGGVESFSMGDSASGSVYGHERLESSGSYDDDYPYEPVDAPLSRVDWSHKPVLRLSGCDLPQPREWTLADIGKEIEEDLGEALRAQTDGSANAGLGHGAYSLKAGAGLAAAAAGAGEGEELDRDSEKLLQCLEAVYSSDRVSEEVVVSVEETLKTAPEVQKMFLQVLRHASRRGYANSRGPTLLHGPSFETLARFSYTLLCVCVDRVDYSVAHTLLQLTGNYFQVHEGGADVFRGDRTASGVGRAGRELAGGGGADDEGGAEQPGYFSEFLSARISRHPIFTDMRFWQHVLSEAVQAKTEKIAKDRHTLASARRDAAGNDNDKGKEGSLLSSSGSPDDGATKNPGRTKLDAEANRALELKDPALASEIVCRQVKVFLYEMASIGMRAKTAQRYVEAVSLQYKLQPAARNRLSETVRLVWGAVASMSGPGSPPFGSELTQEMSAAQVGWSQAKIDAAADAEIGIPSGPTPAIPGANAGSRSTATSISSLGGGNAAAVTPARTAATPSSTGGASGRPNSASSAFSTGTGAAAAATSKLPTLRLSPSELVNQLQAESSPSPRMPTTPASGGRGRFRSPGTPPQGAGASSKMLSATYSPSSGGGGIKGRGGGSGKTTPSSLSPPPASLRRSETQSLGSAPAGAEVGGCSAVGGGDGAMPAGTWAPGSMSGGAGHGRSRSRGSDGSGTTETALSPRRPLVGARAALKPAEGLEEAEEAPVSPGPSGATLAKRFFFGGTETVRSFASSLSPPQPAEKKSGVGVPAAAVEASTLPSSPTAASAAAPARGGGGLSKSGSSSGSSGGEGNDWAEMASGGKGELPSLLAPVELHGRDGEGATHHGPIVCLAAFGSRACAGSTDGTLSVYDLSLASRVDVLSGHTGPVTTVSCGDDWVLSGSSDSSLRLWQNGGDNASSTTPPRRGFISLGWQAPANAGAFKSKVLAGHQGPITCVSSHPRRVDGKPWLAVSGGEDNQIRMWDLRTRRCKVIFTGHSKAITCLTALREDGSQLILSGAKDCTVRLWDINEASGCKALRKFSGHEGSVGSILKIGPFAAVSCSNDRTLRTWDHRVKGSVGVLRGHTGPVTCVQQMPANRSVLASGSADGTVMMWDVRATAKGPSYTLRGHTDRVTGLLASGGSVYSCSEDASMQEWEWGTGQLKSKFFGSRGKTVGVAASLGGASSGGDGGISCLAGTGSAVLTAGWEKTVRMWPRSSPAPQSQEAVAAAAAAAAASALRR